MPDYKKMYFELAARVADATALLVDAQQHAENIYVESDDTPLILPREKAESE